MHHDERHWNDPWRFEPERFLGEDGCVLPPDHPDRRRYFFSHFSYEREVIFYLSGVCTTLTRKSVDYFFVNFLRRGPQHLLN